MESLQPPQISIHNLAANVLLDSTNPATPLYTNLKAASEKNQPQIIQELAASGEEGLIALMQFLLERQSESAERTEPNVTAAQTTENSVDVAAGRAYQALWSANSEKATEFLQTHFPQGVVPLRSEVGLDYAPLQKLLALQDFQAADQMTLQNLCKLAGPTTAQRKWLYFTEVDKLPIADLQTIDALWLVHSEGRFGFSVQRDIWVSVGKNWEKLWTKIGWKAGNNWTRYPQEFTWNLTAPKGHLPLSNQLRGVRVIAALLSHPAWSK